MRPVVFLKGSENERITQHLQTSVNHWMKTWGAFATEFSVKRLQDISISEGFVFADGETQQGLGLAEQESITRLLFGNHLDKVPQDLIQAQVKTKAISALFSGISTLNSQCQQFLPIAQVSHETGKYFQYEIQDQTQLTRFKLALTETLVLKLLARKSEAKNLVSFAKAIGSEEVKLEVSMALGKVPLQSIKQLSVGDVLVTSKVLTNKLDMTAAGKKVASIELGQKDGRKAVLIESIGNQ